VITKEAWGSFCAAASAIENDVVSTCCYGKIDVLINVLCTQLTLTQLGFSIGLGCEGTGDK
jgi:hypothetical protein